MTQIFTHPYNLIPEAIPEDTHCLIIGTAPPPRFFAPRSQGGDRKPLDVDFYYGSEDNYLWEFLDDIAYEIEGDNFLIPEHFNAEKWREAMRRFLQRHNIWMRDVLQAHQKQPGKEKSAGDNDIVPPSDADFFDFQPVFKAEHSISRVAFTSERTAEWTLRAFTIQGLLTSPESSEGFRAWLKLKIDDALPFSHYITRKFKQPFARPQIGGRDVEFYILPAPVGPRAGVITQFRKRDIYKFVLFPR